MPGDSYPDAANIWLVKLIRQALRDAGQKAPVLGTGKIGTVELAEALLANGSCDIIGMARGLLADPYMPYKAKSGRRDEIVQCIYCNVCKSLDESFKTVVCYLWPQGAVQAPRPDEAMAATRFQWADDVPLSAKVGPGEVRLRWSEPEIGMATGYDVMRSVDGGDYEVVTSCTRSRHLDDSALRDRSMRYRIVPYDSNGFRGPASNTVEVVLDEVAL
jgi:hypothetical protein